MQSILKILSVLRMFRRINKTTTSFKKHYETKSGKNEESLGVYQNNQLEILDIKKYSHLNRKCSKYTL